MAGGSVIQYGMWVPDASQLVTWSTHHSLKSCDELTILFNSTEATTIAFKTFIIVSDGITAYAATLPSCVWRRVSVHVLYARSPKPYCILGGWPSWQRRWPVQKSHVGETRHCCVLACWLHDEMCLWQVERVTSWLVSWVPIVLRLVANYTFFAFMYGWQEGHCTLCHLSQEVFLNASKNYSASHLPAVIALNTWRYSPIAYCIIFFPFFSLMKACFNFCSVILFYRLDDRQSCWQSIAFGVS